MIGTVYLQKLTNPSSSKTNFVGNLVRHRCVSYVNFYFAPYMTICTLEVVSRVAVNMY